MVDTIKEQARILADEYRKSDPTITDIYWFPSEKSVRLVLVDSIIPCSVDDVIYPFYFGISTEDDIPFPTEVAIICPEEYLKISTPIDWGDWDTAEKI